MKFHNAKFKLTNCAALRDKVMLGGQSRVQLKVWFKIIETPGGLVLFFLM